ncbi:MAG: DUF3048 domain-containing protein [Defluviitaleaceae bacterium]|nr:DUF3048 domain-containing protein [Defluviitaleaceae bacterium]
MMDMLRRFRVLIALGMLAGCLVVAACANDDESVWYEGGVFIDMPSPPPSDGNNPPTASSRAIESPFEFLPFLQHGGPFSSLTGLPIEEQYLYRRPFAAVINNSSRAQPQSGIASADIIYEVLAEGDITRLVGIFQSYIPEKLGPMRSARDYFIDFALNHDALFIHHGSSPSGYSRINNLRVTNLDGMALEGTVFWRDRTYPEWAFNTGTRPLEHSSYTGRERLLTHLYNRGIRDYWQEYSDVYGFNFNFGSTAHTNSDGGQAYVVTVPFSQWYYRRFVFDPETGLYMAENRHGPNLDADTAEHVGVGNILVQFTTMRVIDGEGRRVVDTVGSGNGYLISGGRYQVVRWAKDSHTAPMRWYFADGTPLTLRPGRIWICVFQAHGDVIFE